MDFFARQDQARRNTKWLLVYFVLSVALTIVLIYAVFAAIFLRPIDSSAFEERPRSRGRLVFGATSRAIPWWNAQLFFAVSGGTLLVVLAGSLYKIASLGSGGSAVALSLGGESLAADPTNPDEQKLRNVVEEMA